MTEETAQAKVMDLVTRVRALKLRKVGIQSELDERFDSWARLVQADRSNLGETRFQPGEKDLDILRPWPGGYVPPNRPPLNCVTTLKRECFDGDSLWQLLTEREELLEKIARIERQLKDAGLSPI